MAELHCIIPQRMTPCDNCTTAGCDECANTGYVLIDMTVEERLEAIETKLGIGPLD